MTSSAHGALSVLSVTPLTDHRVGVVEAVGGDGVGVEPRGLRGHAAQTGGELARILGGGEWRG